MRRVRTLLCPAAFDPPYRSKTLSHHTLSSMARFTALFMLIAAMAAMFVATASAASTGEIREALSSLSGAAADVTSAGVERLGRSLSQYGGDTLAITSEQLDSILTLLTPILADS